MNQIISSRYPQTQHLVYLQLRRDVIDERLQTNRDDAFQLAALALQAEIGDRQNESFTYFQPDHYLPHVKLNILDLFMLLF